MAALANFGNLGALYCCAAGVQIGELECAGWMQVFIGRESAFTVLLLRMNCYVDAK